MADLLGGGEFEAVVLALAPWKGEERE